MLVFPAAKKLGGEDDGDGKKLSAKKKTKAFKVLAAKTGQNLGESYLERITTSLFEWVSYMYETLACIHHFSFLKSIWVYVEVQPISSNSQGHRLVSIPTNE